MTPVGTPIAAQRLGEPGRVKPGQPWILAAAMLVMASGTLPVTVVPVLFPLMEQQVPGLTTGHLAVATSTFFGLAACFAPVAGRLVDAAGFRRGAIGVACGSGAIMSTLLLTQSPTMVVAAVGAGGLVNAFAFPTSNLVMGGALQTSRPGLLFGVKQSTVPVVSAAAGAVVGVAGAVSGWRGLLAIFLLVPVTLLALAALRPPTTAAPTEPPVEADAPSLPRRLGPVYAVAFLTGVAVATLASFGVVSLDRIGLTPSAAGVVFGSASVAGLLARMAMGWIADRQRRSLLRLVGVLLLGGAVGGLLVATTRPALASVGIQLAYVLGWSSPGVLLFAVTRAFPDGIGRTTGGLMTSQALGITVGPLLFAVAERHATLGVAWLIAATAWAGAGVVALDGARSGVLGGGRK